MDDTNRESLAQRYCALIIGILFLLVGVAGFLPGFVSLPPTDSPISVDESPNIYAAGFGYLLGLFPTNLLHNIVHIIVGSLGIAAYTSSDNARLYNRGFAIAYALLAVMGLLPVAQTTFGLMPIFGNNVWFNALTAALAGYFGFIYPTQKTPQVDTSPRA